MADSPVTLTVNETAKLLRLGRNQVYQAARRGDLPSIKIGKRRFILSDPLTRMLRGEPAATPAPATNLLAGA